MTGAAIVRREAGGSVFLGVHGAFDGASAWALRVAMDESEAIDFVVDLTYADEAFEFAACILANWVRAHRRERRVRVVPGAPEHARLLTGFGLEVVEEDALLPSVALSLVAAPASDDPGLATAPSATRPTGRMTGAGSASCP